LQVTYTPPRPKKNKQGKLERKGDNDFISKKINKEKNIKEKKRSWSPPSLNTQSCIKKLLAGFLFLGHLGST
jgi:hypothetical protein